MNKKFASFAILLILLFIFFRCGSGGYKIERGHYADTTYKSTGAKLKGTFKVRTPPPFTFQLSAGINFGMSELTSHYANNFDADQFIKGLNFGAQNGYGVMGIGKIPLHKKGNIRLNISAGYNRFESNLFAKNSPYGNVSYNVLTFGTGLENNFSPSLRLKPYIAAEIQANLISGKAIINDLSANTTRNVKIKNTFRIGYIVYSGFEYMFNNRVGVNFGLKLTNSNQILKKSQPGSDPNVITIRDKKVNFTDSPMEFAGFKNFLYTSFFMGVNFYFGVKDIIYKF